MKVTFTWPVLVKLMDPSLVSNVRLMKVHLAAIQHSVPARRVRMNLIARATPMLRRIKRWRETSIASYLGL